MRRRTDRGSTPDGVLGLVHLPEKKQIPNVIGETIPGKSHPRGGSPGNFSQFRTLRCRSSASPVDQLVAHHDLQPARLLGHQPLLHHLLQDVAFQLRQKRPSPLARKEILPVLPLHHPPADIHSFPQRGAGDRLAVDHRRRPPQKRVPGEVPGVPFSVRIDRAGKYQDHNRTRQKPTALRTSASDVVLAVGAIPFTPSRISFPHRLHRS